MLRLVTLCSFALLVACDGGSPPAADKPADKPAAKPADSEKPQPKDRSQAALTTTKETMAGVAFSIDLPADLKRDVNDRDKYVNWTFADGNPFIEPSITAKVVEPMMLPRDLEAFARSLVSPGNDKPPLVVARKEELPDGGMIGVSERSDGQFFKVEAIHRAGDKAVRCTVIQRTGTGRPDDKPIPSFAATRAWAEKICGSVKLE